MQLPASAPFLRPSEWLQVETQRRNTGQGRRWGPVCSFLRQERALAFVHGTVPWLQSQWPQSRTAHRPTCQLVTHSAKALWEGDGRTTKINMTRGRLLQHKTFWLILAGEDHNSNLVTSQEGSMSCACRSLCTEATGSEWVMHTCK